jgi:Flp pilus assembly protein TadG
MIKLVRRSLRREEGASLVEFAIIAPILFLILFGLIDFGFIYNDFLSVRQGVRDGARQGAVANFGTNSTCSNFLGNVSSLQTKQLICATRDRVGLDPSKMRAAVCLAPTGHTATRVGFNNSCSGDTAASGGTDYVTGNSMAVCAMYPATSRSGFLNPFLGSGVVTTRVVIRIEQTSWDLAGLQAPRTTDDLSSGFEDITGGNGFPSGKNWNFCVP